MADLAASNVTVTLTPQDQDFLAMGKRISFPIIAFGNGALTYPANGVPLPAKGAFGMKQEIKRVFIEGMPGDGYVYKYDRVNHTIRIWQGAGFTPAGTVNAPLINIAGDTAGTVPIGIASDANGAVLSKTSAGNKTGILGIQAPAFTGTAVAAGALVELCNVAVAAKTLYLMVVGQ